MPKSKIDSGDFPPCIRITEAEVDSIAGLTRNEFIADEKTRDIVNKKEKSILEVLGRVVLWCQAYHERIGYKPEDPKEKGEN